MFLHIFPHFFGGSVFYGGLIGGAIAAFIAMKKLKTPLYPALDLITPVIPLFHAFGRIGCFLSGCCFGIESNVGFIYNNSINEAANGVRRFPVQLLESGCEFALFAVLFSLYRKGKCKGRLFPIYLTTYGVTRFLDENLRGDTYRGIWNIGGANLSTSQIISIAVILAGIAMLLYKRRGQTPEPART
jgi:phosphatidylglycerol:prolipoprotein diacylglycerol transferase